MYVSSYQDFLFESINKSDFVDFKNIDLKSIYKKVANDLYKANIVDVPIKEIHIKVTKAKKYGARVISIKPYGSKHYYPERMEFSSLYKKTYQEILDIMAHELIHVYTHKETINDDGHHGRVFHRYMKKINDSNLPYNVTVKYDVSSDRVDTNETKQSFVVIVTDSSTKVKLFTYTPKFRYNTAGIERLEQWIKKVTGDGEMITMMSNHPKIGLLTQFRNVNKIKYYTFSLNDVKEIIESDNSNVIERKKI